MTIPWKNIETFLKDLQEDQPRWMLFIGSELEFTRVKLEMNFWVEVDRDQDLRSGSSG